MKKVFVAGLLVAGFLCISTSVYAQQSGIGLGAIINSPTGVSLKGWINEDLALDGAISFSIGENSSSFYLHSDILFHGSSASEEIGLDEGNLQAYYGGGFRFIWVDGAGDPVVGLRGPLGVNYAFENSRAEAFVELVPTLDFNPSFRFLFAGGIGVRYYLN